MFRITTEKKCGHIVVTLDGRLEDSDVEEVRRVLSAVTGHALLSLSGLEACSGGAVTELNHWLASGFTLQGATPFIRMLLINETQKKMSMTTK